MFQFNTKLDKFDYIDQNIPYLNVSTSRINTAYYHYYLKARSV